MALNSCSSCMLVSQSVGHAIRTERAAPLGVQTTRTFASEPSTRAACFFGIVPQPGKRLDARPRNSLLVRDLPRHSCAPSEALAHNGFVALSLPTESYLPG